MPAGFPSPATDYVEASLDLGELLIRHPAATYLVRAEGDSMVGAGIFSGDILIVDRSLEPRVGDVVIAAIDGELTVKALERGEGGALCLAPRNPRYRPIALGEGAELWGVVSASVRRHRGAA